MRKRERRKEINVIGAMTSWGEVSFATPSILGEVAVYTRESEDSLSSCFGGDAGRRCAVGGETGGDGIFRYSRRSLDSSGLELAGGVVFIVEIIYYRDFESILTFL